MMMMMMMMMMQVTALLCVSIDLKSRRASLTNRHWSEIISISMICRTTSTIYS
jgi:hypothetical protein